MCLWRGQARHLMEAGWDCVCGRLDSGHVEGACWACGGSMLGMW